METLLFRLLQLSGGWQWLERRNQTAMGEADITGFYAHNDFIFEVKWTAPKAGRPVSQRLDAMVSRKPGFCGVLVSIAGDTAEARTWVQRANARGDTVVNFDGEDILAVLSEKIPLNYLLEIRLHNAKYLGRC